MGIDKLKIMGGLKLLLIVRKFQSNT